MTPLPGPAITPTPIIGNPSSADVTTPLTLTKVWAEMIPHPSTEMMNAVKSFLILFISFDYKFAFKRAKIATTDE
jgi:hypothetical protein